MARSDTQDRIANAIRELSGKAGEGAPVTTATAIAEHLDVAKQTVLNHIDEVVATEPGIVMESVAGANLYWVDSSAKLFEKVATPRTEWMVQMPQGIEGRAFFAEGRKANEESAFDYEVHWYDTNLDEMEDYDPTAAEWGEAVWSYRSAPVKIKGSSQGVVTEGEE